MNARARRIRAAAVGDWNAPQSAMLDAFAAMLEAATAKPTKAKADPAAKLPVSPGVVFEAIKATGKVLCEPVDSRWFGRLGATLKQLRLERDTLAVLCDWLEAGGIAWWSSPPTFDHVFANLAKWANYALEWDTRGRQELGSKGGVGRTADISAPVNWVRE